MLECNKHSPVVAAVCRDERHGPRWNRRGPTRQIATVSPLYGLRHRLNMPQVGADMTSWNIYYHYTDCFWVHFQALPSVLTCAISRGGGGGVSCNVWSSPLFITARAKMHQKFYKHINSPLFSLFFFRYHQPLESRTLRTACKNANHTRRLWSYPPPPARQPVFRLASCSFPTPFPISRSSSVGRATARAPGDPVGEQATFTLLKRCRPVPNTARNTHTERSRDPDTTKQPGVGLPRWASCVSVGSWLPSGGRFPLCATVVVAAEWR